jgi:hypothetical protein
MSAKPAVGILLPKFSPTALNKFFSDSLLKT